MADYEPSEQPTMATDRDASWPEPDPSELAKYPYVWACACKQTMVGIKSKKLRGRVYCWCDDCYLGVKVMETIEKVPGTHGFTKEGAVVLSPTYIKDLQFITGKDKCKVYRFSVSTEKLAANEDGTMSKDSMSHKLIAGCCNTFIYHHIPEEAFPVPWSPMLFGPNDERLYKGGPFTSSSYEATNDDGYGPDKVNQLSGFRIAPPAPRPYVTGVDIPEDVEGYPSTKFMTSLTIPTLPGFHPTQSGCLHCYPCCGKKRTPLSDDLFGTESPVGAETHCGIPIEYVEDVNRFFPSQDLKPMAQNFMA